MVKRKPPYTGPGQDNYRSTWSRWTVRLQSAGTVKLETGGQTWPCLRCKMLAGLFIIFRFVNNCTDESVSKKQQRKSEGLFDSLRARWLLLSACTIESCSQICGHRSKCRVIFLVVLQSSTTSKKSCSPSVLKR